MIDFVKMVANNSKLYRDLKNNPLLKLKGLYRNNDFDLTDDPLKADYMGLKFKLFPSGRIEINGSLHKYFNLSNGNGNQNYNIFTLQNLTRVLKDLKVKFGLRPDELRLTNVEIGLNLLIPCDPGHILDKLLVYKYRLLTK
jgi:hypothetical protein